MTGTKAKAPKETIVTTHVYPPIPDRGHDWFAQFSWHDGDDPLRGVGATEEDAVFDLITNAWDMDDTEDCAREEIKNMAFDAWKARQAIPNEAELVEIVHNVMTMDLDEVLTSIFADVIDDPNPLPNRIITALRPYLTDGKRVAELEAGVKELLRLKKSIITDVGTAHSLRGSAASEWMREDDRDMSRDMSDAFKALEQALKAEDDK